MKTRFRFRPRSRPPPNARRDFGVEADAELDGSHVGSDELERTVGDDARLLCMQWNVAMRSVDRPEELGRHRLACTYTQVRPILS